MIYEGYTKTRKSTLLDDVYAYIIFEQTIEGIRFPSILQLKYIETAYCPERITRTDLRLYISDRSSESGTVPSGDRFHRRTWFLPFTRTIRESSLYGGRYFFWNSRVLNHV